MILEALRSHIFKSREKVKDMDKIILLLLVAVGGTPFVEADTCPTTIRQLDWQAPPPMYARGSGQPYFWIKIKNQESKPIDEAEIAGVLSNAEGEVHLIPFSYYMRGIKPGKSRFTMFPSRIRGAIEYPELRVWIRRVRFTDGSEWSNADPHRCSRRSIAMK
jgi:hypothetical protein